jgi:hypothetical protein
VDGEEEGGAVEDEAEADEDEAEAEEAVAINEASMESGMKNHQLGKKKMTRNCLKRKTEPAGLWGPAQQRRRRKRKEECFTY